MQKSKDSLRTISGISHAHHSGGGNRNVVLVPSFQPPTNSDQYSFQICLCQMDISTFSRQNKVTKMCPKYPFTRYIIIKWSSQYQILINRSGEIKRDTKSKFIEPFDALVMSLMVLSPFMHKTLVIWT